MGQVLLRGCARWVEHHPHLPLPLPLTAYHWDTQDIGHEPWVPWACKTFSSVPFHPSSGIQITEHASPGRMGPWARRMPFCRQRTVAAHGGCAGVVTGRRTYRHTDAPLLHLLRARQQRTTATRGMRSAPPAHTLPLLPPPVTSPHANTLAAHSYFLFNLHTHTVSPPHPTPSAL